MLSVYTTTLRLRPVPAGTRHFITEPLTKWFRKHGLPPIRATERLVKCAPGAGREAELVIGTAALRPGGQAARSVYVHGADKRTAYGGYRAPPVRPERGADPIDPRRGDCGDRGQRRGEAWLSVGLTEHLDERQVLLRHLGVQPQRRSRKVAVSSAGYRKVDESRA